MIENGKLTQPIKDINIIGNGPKALADITMVGNNYKMDNGTCPSALSDLVDEYIAKGKKFEDATGTELVYTPSGDKLTYTLKGKNADGEPVTSDGSSDAEE